MDDILLSGPKESHQKFWEMLQKHSEIEDPTPVGRVFGRRHIITRDEHGASMKLDMSDFAANACTAYEELSGCVLKKASTPYLPEGSLVDNDFTVRGEMAQDASKVLMKILWSARLARPDLMKGISDLTRKITTWSRADDRRLYRLMSYLKGTPDYMLEGHIRDDPSTLHLSLYTDADHASGIQDVKSRSGMFDA